jgi:hypothetical protein
MRHLLAVLAVGLLVSATVAGCSTTRFYERERIADRAMQLDADRAMTYLRNKLASAREGGFGGYGGAAAGGCGCE